MSIFGDQRARFDRDHPRHADETVSGNPAQSTVDVSGNATGEEIATNDAGEGVVALNKRDTFGAGDATVMNLPRPDTRDISNGMDNLQYKDPIEALQMIDSIARHLEATLEKVTAHEDSLIKTRMRGPVVITAEWTNGATFALQTPSPVPEGEIWLVSPITAYITKTADGSLAAVQAAVYVDAITQANFVALIDGSRATWGNENLVMQAGQTLWFTSQAVAAQNNKVTIRMEVLSVSADMIDTHARY